MFGYNFFQFYTWIGIFNTLYLWLFAFTGVSRIMKFSRRSTEETFAMFVSVTFVVDSVKSCLKCEWGIVCFNCSIFLCIGNSIQLLLFRGEMRQCDEHDDDRLWGLFERREPPVFAVTCWNDGIGIVVERVDKNVRRYFIQG